MEPGTTVYLNWYDFDHKAEHVCMGMVVCNSLWAGTKCEHRVNVSFCPPGMKEPICHHFPEDKLSLTPDNVPHDDCYLVCGKKTRFFEHDVAGKLKKEEKLNVSDAWQQVQQFKQDHWDYQLGHMDIDALDEYYLLWRDAIAAKRGYTPSSVPTVHLTEEAFFPATSVPATTPAVFPTGNKLTKKQKRSTGAIQYNDSIQTSLFD